MRWLRFLCLTALVSFPLHALGRKPIRVMIIGGQNNHDWRKSTPFMEKLLNKAPHIEATVCNAPIKGSSKEAREAWKPQFNEYDCILLDYNGEMWPEAVQKDFVDYVRAGGGVLVIHAANNSFTGWRAYEQMVGLLWRDKSYGASLYVNEEGEVVREEPGQGRNMGHGAQYNWRMTIRDRNHPITQKMPLHWLHYHDELYHGQRGPAEDVHILLTAYSDPDRGRGGTGKDEPIVWWIPFGEGKVVTNVMGHVGQLGPMQCVGFKVLLYRSCEWLATGKCKTRIPKNFPTADRISMERDSR